MVVIFVPPPRDAVDRFEVLPGARPPRGPAEMMQQRLLRAGRCRRSRRAASRVIALAAAPGACRWRSDAPRRAAAAGSTAPGPCGSSGRAPAGHEEPLAAGIAVRTLGDRHQRHVVDAELGEHLARHAETGPGRRRSAPGRASCRASRSGSSFERAGEAAGQHLAHHRVIVARRGPRDLSMLNLR